MEEKHSIVIGYLIGYAICGFGLYLLFTSDMFQDCGVAL